MIKKYEQFYKEFKSEEKVNEELGWKDVVFGVLAIIGLGKAEAGEKPTNKELISKIETTLKDDKKLDALSDELQSMGYEEAAELVKTNSEKIIDELQKTKKSRTGLIATGNFKQLSQKLKDGWAISEVTLDTIQKKVNSDKKLYDTIVTNTTKELTFNSDNLFDVGDFKLSEDFKDSLSKEIKKTVDEGYVILSIEIESSTDKQRVKKDGETAKNLSDMDYSVDNEGLSTARNDEMSSLVEDIFIESGKECPLVTQNILFDQGKGELNSPTPQDPSARYVKIKLQVVKIEVTSVVSSVPTDSLEDVVIYHIKIAKAGEDPDIIVPPGFKPSKGKIKIYNSKTPLGKCPTFKANRSKNNF
jgi:hypothetical protein